MQEGGGQTGHRGLYCLQATKKVQHYKSRYFYHFVTYKFVKCFLLRCLVLPDSVEYKI